MGAGKTTFARALLLAFGVKQPPEGSPSFAIAHEYDTDSAISKVVHIDFYRIRDESEIEEAGLDAHFWEAKRVVISEWLSSWPEFEKTVLERGRSWRVSLDFPKARKAEADSEFVLPAHRRVTIRFREN
jgi:tRNA threonylcarbamoyl adenosine modification protein YjeE